MTRLQAIVVDEKCAKRLRAGYPWVMRSDLGKAAYTGVPAGELADFTDKRGVFAARGFFNPQAQIVGRVLTRRPKEEINRAFLELGLRNALALREKLFPVPYYRLVHAESSGFPGLIIDRYGDVLVAQVNTAGMERLFPVIQDILVEMLAPRAVVQRNDSSSREREGMAREVKVSHGAVPQGPLAIIENGVSFNVDVMNGQKTGWFFDQRENRAFVAGIAEGKTMIDVFCHTGGFGVTAAAKGAGHVTFVDSSDKALVDARANAALNGVEGKCDFIEGKAFDVLQRLVDEEKKYDIVSLDPPAFIKARSDITPGLRGYQKLARIAAPLVEEGGYMFLASCSHHAAQNELLKHVSEGIAKAGRTFQLVRASGADSDHPVHPMLSETGYLKAFMFRFLD